MLPSGVNNSELIKVLLISIACTHVALHVRVHVQCTCICTIVHVPVHVHYSITFFFRVLVI